MTASLILLNSTFSDISRPIFFSFPDRLIDALGRYTHHPWLELDS
ncbi:hypothetical protein SLEP1_g54929 [Rubroshorea leprosula]|uniref:Uncharacterized protein n=1 Tax=Rubroshorea leprosula TaxID=152421 RepID=A0AAV5MGV4_9ROSI|nr:hypothetical protein SLEP1_g54929 [Rubroshorea leprosula]